MNTGKGSIGAGAAFLCFLMLWTGVKMLPDAQTNEARAVLCQHDVYTICQGMAGDAYSWQLCDTWQDTGFLFCADGVQPAKSPETCISMRGTVGGYVPVDGDVLLRPDALYALCDMQNDYSLQEGLRFYQGYVTEDEQNILQAQAKDTYAQLGVPAENCPVPPGGKSEHQLGLSVDVQLTGKLNMREEDPLKRNKTGQWLLENMWQYGFVYSKDFDGCDAIHLRYVGRGHARMMHMLEMDMEEYLAFLRENKTVTLMRGETMIACVQCVTEGDETVLVPQGMRKEISRDNRGNIILYCWAE